MPQSAARKFVSLFGGPRESSDLARIAREACKEGYAVLPVAPGEKRPVCTLTPRQKVAANRMAANAAREAGTRHWERIEHDCGRGHAITDPAEAERVFKRLLAKHPDLNIGLEVGRSRAIAVDCDTASEVASFTRLWAEREGVSEMANAAPTVRSPGKVSADGEWVHKDGGHFWFLLPEGVDFSDSPVSTSMPIGSDPANQAHAMFHDSLVLVPPSIRAEGAYAMASDVFPAPAWLVDDLMLHVEGFALRRDRHLEKVRDGSDSIDVWSSLVTWEDLLTGDGWTTSGRPDKCGCTVWTRPGDWANPKSATAHEPGCTRWDTEAGHGFLHVWTDNPPAHISAYVATKRSKSLSKLQYISWRDFEGNDAEAMRALGIRSNADSDPDMSDDDVFEAVRVSMEEAAQGKESIEEGESPASLDDSLDDDEDDEPELSPFDKLRAEFIPASDLDKIPPLSPLVDGLLDLETTTRVIGQSGHGKTFVMLDLAAHIATGRAWQGRAVTQGRVAYIVAEGAAGFIKRVKAWETYHGVELGDQLLVLPRPVQAANVTDWAVLVEVLRHMKVSMVVIDTQARVTVGMEENSAKDMGLFVDRADRIKRATKACVVLVHHQGHSGDQGRGSSAVLGALDVEISVAKEGKGQIAVLSSKQKDREEFEPIRLMLHKQGESAVIVGRDEVVEGPLMDNLITAESAPRDRIARLLWEHFHEGHGATKAEIKKVIRDKDVGPRGKPMDTATFYRAWSKLEGSGDLVADGARYRLSIATAVSMGLREAVAVSPIRSIQGEGVDL